MSPTQQPHRTKVHPASSQVSRVLREERLIRGETQQMLAEVSGVPYRTIQNFEGGKNLPNHLTVEAIANALGYEFILRRKQ